ncbi:LCP family protein [Anaerobranca gottschalkii]|uniref:LCP family protein n=1 Tax=Anaerobranca gottschalkii TaxID=108328 RepID=UPI000A4734D4|nr:LCP family protein [Anaerobranca gottschalkii]
MKRNTKNKNNKKKIILIIIAALLIPFLIYGGSFAYRLYSLYSSIYQPIDDEDFEPIDPNDLLDDEEIDGEDVPLDQVEKYKYEDDKYYNKERSPKDPNKLNILLIGVDSRTIGGVGRADSIMVVQYNKSTKKSAILSIPRDTFVRIPGRGYDKINHSFAFGRTRLLKETVENYLDIHIDHYVQVDMQSFVKAVDTIGGITVNVPEDMIDYNDNVLFRKGTHHMNGEQVLRYVGARKLKSGGGSDFGRIRRQQQVIAIILNKIIKEYSLNQTLKVMEDISPYIRTDITPMTVINNWSAFTSLNVNEIKMETLTGTGFIHNRVFYLRIPVSEAREKMANLTE